MMKKILVTAISAVLVSACSSNSVIKTDAVTESVDVRCENRVRNLTLPWSADMRCTETRDPATVEAERVSRINERNVVLADKRAERETAVFNELESSTAQTSPVSIVEPSLDAIALDAEVKTDVAPIDNRADAVTDEALPMIEQPAVTPEPTSTSGITNPPAGEVVSEDMGNADAATRIWFAQHLKVLGPSGQQSTKQLAPILNGNGHIKLRGYVLPEEATGHDLETFSVARALAVKRILIREVRIDPDRITILHYSPDTAGRYVEVILNG